MLKKAGIISVLVMLLVVIVAIENAQLSASAAGTDFGQSDRERSTVPQAQVTYPSFKWPWDPKDNGTIKWTGGPHSWSKGGQLTKTISASHGSGLDFAKDEGESFDVVAMASGTAIENKCDYYGLGCIVAIRHDVGDSVMIYAHLEPNSDESAPENDIQVGVHYNQGEIIGHAGQSGGPWPIHLHIEFRDGAADCTAGADCGDIGFAGNPIGWDAKPFNDYYISGYFDSDNQCGPGADCDTIFNYDGSATRGTIAVPYLDFPYIDSGEPRKVLAFVHPTFTCTSTTNCEINAPDGTTVFANQGQFSGGGGILYSTNNISGGGFSERIRISLGEILSFFVQVLAGQTRAVFSTSWPGSDVVMTLTTPSGRTIDRETNAPDIIHDLGATFETYTILDPEPGDWTVNLFGADVPPEGENVIFRFTTTPPMPSPPPELAYMDGSTLVLNMGSEARRSARRIETDEINEEFTVKQLSTELPGEFSVTAFGLTQVYSGVTQIWADGDDGDDVLLLESGTDGTGNPVAFTAPAEIYGGSGDDQIQSGDGDDTLFGNTGDDEIQGGAGEDTINGGDGDDILGGEGGRDAINGGAGSDTIAGGSEDDTLNGNDGDDDITGEAGDDELHGDADSDSLYGGDGNDLMHGGTGDDVMEGSDGDDMMYGDDGQDTMYGGADNDTMEGNDGDDVMYGDDGQDTMYGGAGDDLMNGGAGDDIMEGNDGADTMHGGTENDEMVGQTGDDVMYGDDGQDTMYGNAGADLMHGGAGDDYMEGNEDIDEMYGDDDQDDMIGGTPVAGALDGPDTMYGGLGHDVLAGDNASITRPLAGEQWIVNTFSANAVDVVQRIVELFDVATTDNTPDAGTSGGDEMHGEDGVDILYGQGGEDEIHGGAGDDYMEGNAASDLIGGDGGDDDMLGGTGPTTSNDPATALPGRADASTRTRTVPLGSDPAAVVPLGDTMEGGEGADVMLGDNGIITRPLDGDGRWITLTYSLFEDTDGSAAPRHPTAGANTRIGRSVQMIDGMPGPTAGSDLISGGSGDDDLYGQFDDSHGTIQPAIGDELAGDGGEDAMVGDLGVVDNWVVHAETQIIRSQPPFIEDDVSVQGTLFRQVTLHQPGSGGNDRLFGGLGGDWMHGGAGHDLMNGNGGNDRLFGDGGDDTMWGGPHHDHLWGGHGDDYLDIKPRPAMEIGNGKQGKGNMQAIPADPLEWFAYGGADNYQDIDYIYGGWDQDAMQANVADTGPVPGDRLIDWAGAYNVYYLCPGLYGERVITRNHSPSIVGFLQDLAAGDGAVDTATEGSSGFDEVAIVFSKEVRRNSHPPHPHSPGHFVCAD